MDTYALMGSLSATLLVKSCFTLFVIDSTDVTSSDLQRPNLSMSVSSVNKHMRLQRAIRAELATYRKCTVSRLPSNVVELTGGISR